jgi:hypothetical protein
MDVTTDRDFSGGCGTVAKTLPRCTLGQVWTSAIKRGAPMPALAEISLETLDSGEHSWRFTVKDRNQTGPFKQVFKADIPDDCALASIE